MANQDILINWSPQETRVAVVENGAVQELHIERTLERGLVGNVYLGKVARVLPGMQSRLHRHRPGARRLPARGRPARQPAASAAHATRRAAGADRTPGVRGPDADGAGHQGPDRHQGRAAVDADQSIAGRMLVFLPQDDHIGISQKIGSPERASSCARACRRWSGRRRRRRLHPAHQRRGRQRRRAGRRHRLPAQDLGAHPRARAMRHAAGHAAAPGPEPGRARAARPGQRRHADHPHRLASCSSTRCRPSARCLCRGAAAKLRALQGRAADLRPVRHRGRDRAGAGAAGRSEVAAAT